MGCKSRREREKIVREFGKGNIQHNQLTQLREPFQAINKGGGVMIAKMYLISQFTNLMGLLSIQHSIEKS